MFTGADIPQSAFDRLNEVLGWANDFVKGGYAAGSTFTLADIAFLATYATISACEHVDLKPYAELNAWFEKAQAEVPNYEKANGEGATVYKGRLVDIASIKQAEVIVRQSEMIQA